MTVAVLVVLFNGLSAFCSEQRFLLRKAKEKANLGLPAAPRNDGCAFYSSCFVYDTQNKG
jgi:hypothetical protein